MTDIELAEAVVKSQDGWTGPLDHTFDANHLRLAKALLAVVPEATSRILAPVIEIDKPLRLEVELTKQGEFLFMVYRDADLEYEAQILSREEAGHVARWLSAHLREP